MANLFKYYIYLLCLALWCLESGCGETLPPIQNLNNNHIEALGHGGMGVRSLRYPFNALESIAACFEAGAAGTELDVQLTADNQLVVLHDQELANHTDGSGLAIEHTLAELTEHTYDFLSLGTYQITGLEAVLAVGGSETILMLDCKPFAGDVDYQQYIQRFATAIDALATSYQMEDRLIVESRDSVLLLAVKGINPRLKLFYQPWDLAAGKDFAMRNGLFGLSLPLDRCDATYIEALHQAGIRVAIFGTTTRDKNRKAVALQPEYIQTDRVSHLVDLLKEE